MSAIAFGRQRRKSLTPRARVLIGFATVIAALLLWGAASGAGLLSAEIIPGPLEVGSAVIFLFGTSSFWVSLGLTLATVFVGLLIVFIIATPLSIAIGRVRFIRESTLFVIEFLKPIPPVALLPLTLLVLGISADMKLFLVVFGALWALLTQMTYGVRETDGVALAMSKSYRLGTWRTIRSVVMPSLLPFTATGLRISASIALIVSVVTEMLTGVGGIGQLITMAQLADQIPQLYALILVTGFIGLGLNALFKLSERWLLFWHPSQRGESA